MNKKYDVLGAGIAAVDDLIYVSDFPAVDCKIPIHASTRQGGGPACTAIAAVGSLGGRAAYAARFGDNDLSKFIGAALQHHGVDTSPIRDDPAGGPYHSIIVVDGTGHRNVFYDPALYRVVAANDLPDSLIQSARLFLLDHLTEPSLLPVAEKVRGLGVSILGDIEGQSESAINLAALTDYLIVPKAFAIWASNALNPRDACAFLAHTPREATVLTDGSHGGFFSTRTNKEVRHFPAFAVDAIDTNGCGDTFHGAFALAVARDLAIEEAITFASAAAALKAVAAGGERRGWDALPTLDEVFGFLRTALDEPEKSALLQKFDLLRDPAQSTR
jgi:sugar/nucleoside kinase (ribokinase family)